MTSSSSFCFPPAHSWYSPHVLATSDVNEAGDGAALLAYHSKLDVVLLDPTAAKPSPRVLRGTYEGKAKLCAVDVNASGTRVAVGVDDGTVRMWDVSSKNDRQIALSSTKHTVHRDLEKDRHRVQALCWSVLSPSTLFSADEVGNVVVWDARINSTRSLSFNGKHNVIVMRAAGHADDVVAIGCKKGLILVCSTTGSGKTLQRIRFHDEDVHDISWAPIGPNVFSEDGEEDDPLFAVSSRDRQMSVWSARTGRQRASMRIGPPYKQQQQRNDFFWFPCLWLRPDTLVTGGTQGEMVTWDLARLQKCQDGVFRGDDKRENVNILHREHNRVIYSIVAAKDNLFSVGQDRFLVSHSPDRGLNYCLPTFAGFIYCIESSPLEPKLLAIGAGDSNIRVWREGSQKSVFDVSLIWQRLNNAKVTALAWHPEKEGLLAVGTDEGRIMTVETLNARKNANLLDYKHRGQVYNLTWGPPSYPTGSTVDQTGAVLYSCGDNAVFMHSMKANVRSANVESIVEDTNSLKRKAPNRSSICLHPSNKIIVALGSDDGSVEIFLFPHLVRLTTLKSFHKLIQSLAWHPAHFMDMEKESKYTDHLAVASNDSDIHIFDLSDVIKRASVENGDSSSEVLPSSLSSSDVVTSADVTLSGHLTRVISLSWSPHEEGKLVSVAYDATAQVWDAFSTSVSHVANFGGHNGRLFCCHWSPSDPDLIFVGGEEGVMYAFKISEQTDKLPTKKPTKKAVNRKITAKEAHRGASATSEEGDESTSVSASMRQLQLALEEKRRQLLEADGVENAVNTSEVVGLKYDKRKTPKVRHYFPLSENSEAKNQFMAGEDCLFLSQYYKKAAEGKTAKLDGEEQIHLGLFCDMEAAQDVLEKEATHLVSQGNLDAALHLHLVTGDLEDIVRKAIKSGSLSDKMVSLAAGCSHSLWKEACSAYALQLSTDDAMKAATYYLMIHQVMEAIDVLKKKGMFRPAVAIAKSRFPSDSPFIRELFRAWSISATATGSYEISAKCLVACGDPITAASVLAKRPDPSALRTAAMLCLGAGEVEKARVFALQAAALAVQRRNREELGKIKTNFAGFGDFQKYVIVDEEVKLEVNGENNSVPEAKNAVPEVEDPVPEAKDTVLEAKDSFPDEVKSEA